MSIRTADWIARCRGTLGPIAVDALHRLISPPAEGRPSAWAMARDGCRRCPGEETQRVALARALAPRPRLLLLDEPLAALDRSLRERLLADLKSVLTSTGTTALFVTHDQGEAFAVADRVAVMRSGSIRQEGPPARGVDRTGRRVGRAVRRIHLGAHGHRGQRTRRPPCRRRRGSARWAAPFDPAGAARIPA